MVDTFVSDVFVPAENGRRITNPNLSTIVFALLQSTAHQVISFYAKVGMFFYPNKNLLDNIHYKRFITKEFVKYQNSEKLKNEDGFLCVSNIPTLFVLIVVAIKEKFLKVLINGKEEVKRWSKFAKKDNPLCNEYKESNVTRLKNNDGSPHKKYWYSNIAKVEFDMYIENRKKNSQRISIEDMLYMFSYGSYPFTNGYHKIGGWTHKEGLGYVCQIVKSMFEKYTDKTKGNYDPLWNAYDECIHKENGKVSNTSNDTRNPIFNVAESKILKAYIATKTNDSKYQNQDLSRLIERKIIRYQDQLTRMVYLQHGLSTTTINNNLYRSKTEPLYMAGLHGIEEF